MAVKTNIFISTILVLLVTCGCTEEPTASFTMSKSKAFLNESVSFNNTSISSDSFAWNFGDGATSDEENPIHKFKKLGTNEVTLTVVNNKGTDYITKEILIEFLFSGCVEISNEFSYSKNHLPIVFLNEIYSMDFITINNSSSSGQDIKFEGGNAHYSYIRSFGRIIPRKVDYSFDESGNKYSFYFKNLSIEYTKGNASVVYKSMSIDYDFVIEGTEISNSEFVSFN